MLKLDRASTASDKLLYPAYKRFLVFGLRHCSLTEAAKLDRVPVRVEAVLLLRAMATNSTSSGDTLWFRKALAL